MIWIGKHPQFHPEMLGIIPTFFNEGDDRPARAQIDSAYIGGWSPMPGFKMLPNGNLSYPGDPPVILLAESRLRDEVIRFYDHAWVAVIQPDGSFEVSRLD
jgi:hypothetical protein